MRPKHLVTLLVLLALAVASAPTPAQAGGVVTVCDEAHLLAALAGGGTVTFSCSGMITLTAAITIAAVTTFDGSGQTVTISGNHAVRVFTVDSGGTLNLNELTVADGSADTGGGIHNSGTANVNNTTLSGNIASGGAGGGIDNYGTLTVSNSTFFGNSANAGGGIHNSHGVVTVSNSTVSDNTAVYSGGGLYNYEGTMTVGNSTFSGNRSTGYSAPGGAIDTFGGTLAVNDSTFSSNSAQGGGGGIDSGSYGGTVTVSNSAFSNNSAQGGGGGIASTSALIVSNSRFSDNSARYGGGIRSGSTLTVSNSTFSGNSTSGDGVGGGGIESEGTVIVTNSTFSGNNAAWGGGGLHTIGTATVSNSTFSSNSAYWGGGGIWQDFGTMTVSNSTFSSNSGGGISGGTVFLKNTIVANSPTGNNCSGAITDGGGNLSYPDTTCPGINSDPKLGPLRDNGGPTHTMALGVGSAARDAANDTICAAAPVNNLDQRGIARPQGPHCDIGAFEHRVVTVCDEVHLLAALADSGSVTFSCSGTITLAAEIPIAANTTIDGSGQTVTISGNNSVRVFRVSSGGTLNLNWLTVADGSADTGGGISNGSGGALTVSNSTFSGNSASTYGGGIYNGGSGTVTVSNSTFSGNSAHSDGGGICNYDGTLIVSNSTFSGNSANDHGGGIRSAGTLSVSNSTFAGNNANGGGGIFIRNGAAQVSNSTFSGNSATNGGGGIYNYNNEGAVTTLQNTIVANSPAGGNCAGAIADGSGNLSYPDTTCPGINSDPKLGPLQNNLGPTQTVALLPGSAAIDAGNDAICAAAPVNNLDQRGISRPQGPHCDIGAFEVAPHRTFLPLIMR
jgi:predicted outer membrane repeat protein